MGEKIHTSVDQLMQIVKKYEKISFKEAAKELNVPVSTIQDWVTILEEEHLVKVIYSFTTPYIVHQALSETDKKARIKRFDQQKDNLNVKLDMTAQFFTDLDTEMAQIASIVESVEKNMDQKLVHIQNDLIELSNAESKKEELDSQIIESKQRSLNRIQELERHIQKSENHFEESFSKIKKDFDADVKILSQNKTFLDKMHAQEAILKKKLDECNAMSQKIEADYNKQNKSVSEATTHIALLQKERSQLLAEIEKEHTNLADVLSKSKSYETSITGLQKQIYTKISEKEKEITQKLSDSKTLPKSIKLLLEKKNKLKNIVSDLTHAQEASIQEIARLKHEAQILHKHVGMKNVDKELAKIHAEIEEMKKQKGFITTRLNDLFTFLNIKEKK